MTDNKIGFMEKVAERVHAARSEVHSPTQSLWTPAGHRRSREPPQAGAEFDRPEGLLPRHTLPADDTLRHPRHGPGLCRRCGRAKAAGFDGVELHGASVSHHGSSSVRRSTTAPTPTAARWSTAPRFVLDIVRAIRDKVGTFHLQMKINGMDHNDWLYPWERKGNSLAETLEICQILEDERARRGRVPRFERRHVPAPAKSARRHPDRRGPALVRRDASSAGIRAKFNSTSSSAIGVLGDLPVVVEAGGAGR